VTERIEPALSAEEWVAVRQAKADGLTFDSIQVECGSDAGLIAFLNDELPDSDPRKITREKLGAVRHALAEHHVDLSIDQYTSLHTITLATLLAALESYLPPP
jgi:hypothetical protein